MINASTEKTSQLNGNENYRDLTINCSFYRLYQKKITILVTDDYHTYQIEEAEFIIELMKKMIANEEEMQVIFVTS